MKKINNVIIMHIAFFIYSLASLFSKKAGISNTNLNFLIFYGLCFLCLMIYAILWQKVLNKNSLTSAYLNKGITILWGVIFGIIFFKEKIFLKHILGIILVIIGITISNLGEIK